MGWLHPEDDAADAVPGAADSGLVAAGPDEPAEAGPADVLDEAFLRGFVDAPGVSSDDAGVPAPAAASPVDDAQPVESAQAPPADDTDADAGDDAAAFADLSLEGSAALPAAPDTGAAAALEDIALEALPAGPAAALAFATDAETEVALRDGLFGYENVSSEGGDPQVWQGGLRAAIAALADGHSAPLIFVDIDGIPYPAGAIHELASVCEVGTVVVAMGSDASARPGRELLLAGVSDYASTATPPPAPSVSSVRALLGHLANRTHLVLVTGFPDPDIQLAIMQHSDVRALLYEPTLPSLSAAVRGLALLGTSHPATLVQSCSRTPRSALSSAHIRFALSDRRPDVVIPFDRGLHAATIGEKFRRPGRAYCSAVRKVMDFVMESAAVATLD